MHFGILFNIFWLVMFLLSSFFCCCLITTYCNVFFLEFDELSNGSKKRRPTFIETSEAEWLEYREDLDHLFQIGWNGIHHFADIG